MLLERAWPGTFTVTGDVEGGHLVSWTGSPAVKNVLTLLLACGGEGVQAGLAVLEGDVVHLDRSVHPPSAALHLLRHRERSGLEEHDWVRSLWGHGEAWEECGEALEAGVDPARRSGEEHTVLETAAALWADRAGAGPGGTWEVLQALLATSPHEVERLLRIAEACTRSAAGAVQGTLLA